MLKVVESVEKRLEWIEALKPLLQVLGLGEDLAPSLPMLLDDGYGEGVFFAAPPDPGGETTGRPVAWATYCGRTGKPLSVHLCRKGDDLADTEIFPLDKPLPAKLPGDDASCQPSGEAWEFLEYYRVFRPGVFRNFFDLDQAQQEAFEVYRALFYRSIPEAYYPFYQGLAPAFCNWMGLTLEESGVREALEPDDTELADPWAEAAAEAEKLGRELEELRNAFDRMGKTDERRQEMLDNLHRELQEYRNDLLDRLTRPMEMDIISMIDSMGRTVSLLEDTEPGEQSHRKLLGMLAGVATDLTDILYRGGVEPFQAAGTSVDITRQKIFEVVQTGDKTLDKKVAKRMAPGYQKGDKVIRPEKISVFVYEEID